MSKLSIKFFPFSPGIPWNLKKGKYIIPDVPYKLLNSKLKNKNITTISFNGLFESYYSLSVFEMLNRKMPGQSLFWAGNSKFQTLVHRQGLAKISPYNLKEDIIERFPTPIFFDKEDGAYFNVLNNYRYVYTYRRRFSYHNQKAALSQILPNLLVQWDDAFFPKFRNYYKCPSDLKSMLKARAVDLQKFFVLIIPNKLKDSSADFDCLKWSHVEFNSLISMLNHSKITPIVISERGNIHLQNAKTIPFNLDHILYLMSRSKAIVSASPDFQLMSLGNPNIKLISLNNSGEFSIKKNAKYLNSKNRILIKDKLDPVEVWDFIMN